jgi:hypothetical protein
VSQLRSVLMSPTPPQVAPARLRPIRGQWLTTAATLAAMLMVVWVGLWWRQPLLPTLPTEMRRESIWLFIEGVSTAIFPTVEFELTAIPDRLSDLADLQAALAGEWPCDEPAAVDNPSCDNDTFALLLGEQ